MKTEGVLSELPSLKPQPVRVLIVEDSDDDATLTVNALKQAGFDVTWKRVQTAEEMSQALEGDQWDLIISDYSMPAFDGAHALELLKARNTDIPFIVVSGMIGEDVAVEMMRAGAQDYLIKGNLGRLGAAVARELNEASARAAHRRTEKERHRLEVAIAQSAEAVMITDTKGVILFVNPAFEQISGYSCSEAVGKNSSILNSGSHSNEFFQSMWSTLTSGQTWSGVFINRRKDGGLYEEFATISPVYNPAGEIINYVAVKRDMTAQRDMERRVMRSQKMAALGQFAHRVGHDVTNGLAIISVSAELLAIEAGSEKSKELSSVIMTAIGDIAALTTDLMSFASPGVGRGARYQLDRMVIGMREIIARACGSSISIEYELCKGCAIKADAERIEQAIMHLVINAMESMGGSGQIQIRLSKGTLQQRGGLLTVADGTRPAVPAAILEIEDNGCGVTQADAERVFEPFFTTKRNLRRNAGLGLPTVYGIVSSHEGDISFSSVKGKGTVVRVMLPLVD